MITVFLSNSYYDLQATDIGVFVPVSYNTSSLSSKSPLDFGLGFALDTKLIDNSIFSYRLNISTEYIKRNHNRTNEYYSKYYKNTDDGWTNGDPFPFMGTVGYSKVGTYENFSRFYSKDLLINIDNTLEIEFYQEESFTFWVGPQIIISSSLIIDEQLQNRHLDYGYGGGLSSGIDYKLNDQISLGTDVGIKKSYFFSQSKYIIDYQLMSLCMNFYVFFSV